MRLGLPGPDGGWKRFGPEGVDRENRILTFVRDGERPPARDRKDSRGKQATTYVGIVSMRFRFHGFPPRGGIFAEATLSLAFYRLNMLSLLLLAICSGSKGFANRVAAQPSIRLSAGRT